MRYSSLILIFSYLCSTAQVTIYSENFGTTPSFVSVSTYTGYQHYGENTYTGTASVRNTLPSTGYAGASGTANVFFTNVAGTFLQIDGIDTYCYLFAFLSVGIWKSTTASNGSEFVIEYSDNGGAWVQMPFVLPTGSGTAIWRNVTLSDYLPITNNLSLRFRQTSSAGVQFRVDDINVAGIQNATDSFISNCSGFIYDGNIYTQDSLYEFVKQDHKGCDSIVRIEYQYDPTDPTCLLPIELSDFRANRDGSSIVLTWTTLSEYNNSHFEIIRDYQIGEVTAQNKPSTYTFTDEHPKSGINYYRLKQVDMDGSYTYSPIVYAVFNRSQEIPIDILGRTATKQKRIPLVINGQIIIIK
jgi:hypothetical protein